MSATKVFSVKQRNMVYSSKTKKIVVVQPYRHSGFRRNDGGELNSGTIKSPWLIAEAQITQSKKKQTLRLERSGAVNYYKRSNNIVPVP